MGKISRLVVLAFITGIVWPRPAAADDFDAASAFIDSSSAYDAWLRDENEQARTERNGGGSEEEKAKDAWRPRS